MTTVFCYFTAAVVLSTKIFPFVVVACIVHQNTPVSEDKCSEYSNSFFVYKYIRRKKIKIKATPEMKRLGS